MSAQTLSGYWLLFDCAAAFVPLLNRNLLLVVAPALVHDHSLLLPNQALSPSAKKLIALTSQPVWQVEVYMPLTSCCPCSITQRSPPRRTSSSSASAAEKDRASHAGQAGMATEAAERAAQYAPAPQSLHAASGNSPDPGHLFSLEKLNRQNQHSDSMPKKRNDMPTDATSNSGFRAREFDRDDEGHGHPSAISSQDGPQANPTPGMGTSQHSVTSANAQSSRSSASCIGSHSTDEQARSNTLPRQGITSLALLPDSFAPSGLQSDSLPPSNLVHTSSGSRDAESRHDQDSETTAGTAWHDTQQDVHAQRASGDEATSLPYPTGNATAIAAAEAAAKPAAMQASGRDSPAAAAAHSAASSLSQMHQSMRKSNGASC